MIAHQNAWLPAPTPKPRHVTAAVMPCVKWPPGSGWLLRMSTKSPSRDKVCCHATRPWANSSSSESAGQNLKKRYSRVSRRNAPNGEAKRWTTYVMSSPSLPDRLVKHLIRRRSVIRPLVGLRPSRHFFDRPWRSPKSLSSKRAMWANGAPLPSLTNQRLSLDRETPRSDLSLFGMASNEANLTDLIATVHPACVG